MLPTMISAVDFQYASAGRNEGHAQSGDGARGVMMLTADTAQAMGIKDRTDPQQSITAGARYLAQVREMIGRGAPLLIERAVAQLGVPMDQAAQAVVLQRYLQHYECIEAGAGHSARVYPGVRECLQQLHRQGLRRCRRGGRVASTQ